MSLSSTLSANQFLSELQSLQSNSELKNVERFFREEDADSQFIGVKMASIFALAKKYIEMPLAEVSTLLDSEFYEARMGAVSIMDLQARDKKIAPNHKKGLFDLYLSKHDRINNWDLVDRSAPYVVGGYLFDKDRTILYDLAKSDKVWERRTAIVSTYFLSDKMTLKTLSKSPKY